MAEKRTYRSWAGVGVAAVTVLSVPLFGGPVSADAAVTLRDRLDEDRLRHRAARLDRVLAALRARARTYDEPPEGLRLAISDVQEQLDSARARIASGDRRPGRRADGPPAPDEVGHPPPLTRTTNWRPDAA